MFKSSINDKNDLYSARYECKFSDRLIYEVQDFTSLVDAQKWILKAQYDFLIKKVELFAKHKQIMSKHRLYKSNLEFLTASGRLNDLTKWIFNGWNHSLYSVAKNIYLCRQHFQNALPKHSDNSFGYSYDNMVFIVGSAISIMNQIRSIEQE